MKINPEQAEGSPKIIQIQEFQNLPKGAYERYSDIEYDFELCAGPHRTHLKYSSKDDGDFLQKPPFRWNYVPLSAEFKFSPQHADCLGIAGLGTAKNGENLSFVFHIEPNTLIDNPNEQRKLIVALQEECTKLKQQCPNARIVRFGGKPGFHTDDQKQLQGKMLERSTHLSSLSKNWGVQTVIEEIIGHQGTRNAVQDGIAQKNPNFFAPAQERFRTNYNQSAHILDNAITEATSEAPEVIPPNYTLSQTDAYIDTEEGTLYIVMPEQPEDPDLSVVTADTDTISALHTLLSRQSTST